MPNGLGRRGMGQNSMGQRRGSGQGAGFGFRGTSPPWPYVGRGRGGLPRCGYYLGGAAVNQAPMYRAAQGTTGYPLYGQSTSKEDEMQILKEQAEAIKGELDRIESRMNELDSKKE